MRFRTKHIGTPLREIYESRWTAEFNPPLDAPI